MAPKISGTLHGLVDTVYSAGGFVVPIIGNTLVSDYSVAIEWRPVWISVIVCCVIWLIVYNCFCESKETRFSGKVQIVRVRNLDHQLNLNTSCPGDKQTALNVE